MELVLELGKPMEDEVSELNRRKAIGLSHLEKNNFREAVNIYKGILTDFPNDVESYLLLGDLYLANQDYLAAGKIYQKALSICPDNLLLRRRLQLTNTELGTTKSEQVPTDVDSVSKLLQGLTGRASPIFESEIQKAADLLDAIVHAVNPAEMVAQKLEQIDELLPALIELNIRQAKNDRRLDLVTMLQALQDNISTQVELAKILNSESEDIFENLTPPIDNFFQKVKFLLPDPHNPSARMCTLISVLQKQGCLVQLDDGENNQIDPTIDLAVASNPHLKPEIVEHLAILAAQHIPIVIDLDQDFENIPVNHPDYEKFGLESIEQSRSYTASLLLANLVTVPGESFANHLREKQKNVAVLPYCWSKDSAESQLKPQKRNSINIGLIGSPGNFEDIQKYRRIIIRTLREFPNTRLVVCGDAVSYKLFESIPENRRVFIPRVPDEELPYVLAQMDLLLVPLNTSPYHMATHDRVLLQAGIAKIPWIATPIPDFKTWDSGGVTADKPEEWHSYLRQFIQDSELRHSLGLAGYKQAEKRENRFITTKWLSAITSIKHP
jgi:glycosyltransferase involved in cell wall biosynthesis